MKIPGLCLLLVQFACSPVALGHPGATLRGESPAAGQPSGLAETAPAPDPKPDQGARPIAQDHRSKADLLLRSGLVSEAITHYLRAIESDPGEAAGVYFKLGLAYQAIRQFDDALFSYGEAVRLEPGSVWAHAALAIVYAKVGNPEAAFASYRDVKALDRETARGLLPVLLQYGKRNDV